MLKTIIEKAIGEDIGDGYVQEYSMGYNLAKAEMRAKIPQIVEEIVKEIRNYPIPRTDIDWEVFLPMEALIKSLTENHD